MNAYATRTVAVVIPLALFAFLYMPSQAHAATYTWDGGGATNDWSECANWSTDVCPTSSDTAVFDGTSTKDATVDASFGGSIAGLQLNAGYTGTTTLARSLTLSGSYSQADGTLALGSNTFSVQGHFTITGGIFDEGTSTVIFTGSTPTIDVVTSETFYNLILNLFFHNSFLTISSGDTFVITNNVTLTRGYVQTGIINPAAGATVTVGSGAVGGNATVLFDDTGDQTIQCTNGGWLPALTVNKPSGTLDFSCTSMTLDSTFTLQSGTFTAPESLTINGNFTISGGTFDEGTGTVTFAGAGHDTFNVSTTETFYNLTFDMLNSWSVSISTGDTIVVTNALAFSNGSVSTGTINPAGAATVTVGSGADGGSATLLFDDTGDQTIQCTNGGWLPALTVNKPSGTLDFSCTSMTLDSTFTLQSGTFTAPESLTINGNFTISGGTFDEGTGTVSFESAGHETLNVPTTETFYNLTFAKWSGWHYSLSGDTLIILNTLTLSDGVVNTGVLEAQGNVTVSSGYDSGSASMLFSGSSPQTFTLGSASQFNADITINKSAGAVTLASDLTVDASNQDLTITEGILDLEGFTLTESGSGAFSIEDGGTLRLEGGETVSTPTLAQGATVEYDGTGSYSSLPVGTAYQNLSFTGSGTWTTASDITVAESFNQTAGTFTHTGTLSFTSTSTETATTSAGTDLTNLTVNMSGGTLTLAGSGLDLAGDLTLTAGTLDASASGCSAASCDITLAGDWTNTAGTYTARTGTVTLDGTAQSITGDTSFHNLQKSVAAADTLTFGDGDTQTVTGTWTMQGADGQLLSLRSAASGTAWMIDPSGTRTLAYLDVKDSNNTNATAITTSGQNITDSGGNTNWNFNAAPDTPTTLGAAAYVDGSYVSDDTPTLTFTTADNEGDNVTFTIEVDDSSDFVSPVVDYTSASVAAGASSFTVGQAAVGGTYSTGSEGQTLADTTYYWRVLASDAGASSAYATANGGAAAFTLDTAAPQAGTLTIGTIGTSTLDVSLAGASDGGSGLTATPYTWYEATDAATTGATTTTTWTRDALTPNTAYTFTVGVADAAGLTASTSAATAYTLAMQPTALTAAPDSDTEITFAWSGGQNPVATEYYAENTTLGTNSGWTAATSWISSGLTAETAYAFSVKARNGDGTETALASTTATTNATPSSGHSAAHGQRRSIAPPGFVKHLLRADPDTSLLVGPRHARAGELVTLILLVRNTTNGDVGTGGDTVGVVVGGANTAYPTVTDNGDGTYTARYAAANVGEDTVTAYVNGGQVRRDTDRTADGILHITVRPSQGPATTPAVPDADEVQGEGEDEAEREDEEDTTSEIPSTSADAALAPFALEHGLTASCHRAFSWNRDVAATVYRTIGEGQETTIATMNAATPWYVDIDPLDAALTYRFVFNGATDTTVSFSADELASCTPSGDPAIVAADIDHDGAKEQFIDGIFQDTDGSSVPLATVEDGLLIDTDADQEPDTFWNPDVGISPIILAGDRLYITDGTVTEITMYEPYERSAYDVVLRFLANGRVALAAEGEVAAAYAGADDTLIIGPGTVHVPIRYVLYGGGLLLVLAGAWYVRRRYTI